MIAPAATRLLGLELADLTQDAAVRWIDARPADAGFGYVVTPNADHFVRLRHDPSLAAIYQTALLRLLNSRVVAAAARGLGLPAPSVVTGSDLTRRLLDRLPRGERITIIGLRPDRLAVLRARYRLAEPAHYDPPRELRA